MFCPRYVVIVDCIVVVFPISPYRTRCQNCWRKTARKTERCGWTRRPNCWRSYDDRRRRCPWPRTERRPPARWPCFWRASTVTAPVGCNGSGPSSFAPTASPWVSRTAFSVSVRQPRPFAVYRQHSKRFRRPRATAMACAGHLYGVWHDCFLYVRSGVGNLGAKEIRMVYKKLFKVQVKKTKH